MPAALHSTSHGLTMVLTISNPERRNALGPEIYAAGIEALGAAETSAEVRSVVIAGEGAHFCAGGDLQRLQANRREPPEVQAQSIESLHNWIEAIRTFPKPVIAAVEGAAAGAGFSLVLACDFIVAASNAVFAMSYSSVALPRQLATEILMLGGRIGPDRLHALGLVNRLAAPGTALAEALALGEALNARAPNALGSIKDLVNEADGAPLSQQLARERDHFVANLHHANAGIGIAAFLDKSTPRYP